MKTGMKAFFLAVLVMVLCMALTCANAAVLETPDRNAGRITDETSLIAVIVKRSDMERQLASIPSFILPASLHIIEDEAFEGTSIVRVALPGTVESIGEGAFANIPTLRSINIPDRTRYIGQTAFAGSEGVTITGVPGSYARTWARENGVPFAPIAVYCADNQNVAGAEILTCASERIVEDDSDSAADTYPLWRADEIKTEIYEQEIEHQVQGRSPPICA